MNKQDVLAKIGSALEGMASKIGEANASDTVKPVAKAAAESMTDLYQAIMAGDQKPSAELAASLKVIGNTICDLAWFLQSESEWRTAGEVREMAPEQFLTFAASQLEAALSDTSVTKAAVRLDLVRKGTRIAQDVGLDVATLQIPVVKDLDIEAPSAELADVAKRMDELGAKVNVPIAKGAVKEVVWERDMAIGVAKIGANKAAPDLSWGPDSWAART